MKTLTRPIVACAVTICLTQPVLAESDNADFDPHSECSRVSRAAEAIMKLRLDGVPMREMMDLAYEHGGTEEQTELALALTEMAYERPRVYSQSSRDDMITSFGNNAYRGCLRGLGK